MPIATVLYSVLYFLVLFSFLFYFSKTEKGVSSFFVFGLFATIYYVSIPIEMAILDQYSFISEPHILTENTVNKETVNIIILMSTLALAGFGIGYYYSGFNTKISFLYKSNIDKKPMLTSFIILAILIGSVILIFYGKEIIAISNYSQNVNIKAINPLFNYLSFLIVLIISILQSYFILTNRINFIQAICISIIIGAWAIYSSDKDPLLLGFLPLVLFINRVKQFAKFKYQLISYSIVIISIPILVIAFSEYRGYGKVTFENVNTEKGMYKLTDARGGMRVLTTIMLEEDFEYSYGKTYLQSLVLWVPKAIWPNRPLDAPQSFAKTHIKNWKPGQGLGYSPLAEAYLNFGVFGAFIHFLLFGFIWGAFWNTFRKLFDNRNLFLFNSVYSVFGFYILIIMHRGASNAIITTMLQVLIPISILILALRTLENKILKPT